MGGFKRFLDVYGLSKFLRQSVFMDVVGCHFVDLLFFLAVCLYFILCLHCC